MKWIVNHSMMSVETRATHHRRLELCGLIAGSCVFLLSCSQLAKIRDKVLLMHNIQLQPYKLHVLEAGGVVAPTPLSDTMPLSAQGVGTRSVLLARKPTTPAAAAIGSAEEQSTPRAPLSRQGSAAQRSPQPSALQQQQQLQQLSLNSPTAQQPPVRRSSLMLPNTNPFGQVEETLTMISPRSGGGGGGGQHSRNPSSGGSGIPVSPGSAGGGGGGGGGGMHVRVRTGNLSFGQGTWPGKRPSGWSSGDMMAAAAAAAAASGNSGAPPTPTRSPRPTIITANLNNNAAVTATQQSTLLQRANSLPQQQQQPNPFAALERELSPHPSQGQPSFGFNPQQHVAVPVTPVSHHRGSFSGAGGATAVPRSPNPFLALEASQQQQQQQQLQQLQQFQAEQQGQVTPKHMSRRPSHLVSQAQQAAQLRIIDEARIGADSSLRSSANPSPSRDQQHGAPSPLTRAASLSGSTPTPSSLSQRSRANSVSSTLASSLPLAVNPFAICEDVLSPIGSARSRRPSTMFVAPPLNNGAASGGSPVVAAVVASPEAGGGPSSSDSVPAHDKLGQMFGLQPSPVRPSPQLVEPTSAQVIGGGGSGAAPGASSSSASSSTSAADVSSSCTSLRQLSPHLSLLLDAVTLESHDESRDRSEALELREYKLAETRKHIQRIQDAREAQQREHQGRMDAVEAQIAAALEAQKEEERKTAVQTLALEEERAKLEQRLRAIEQRTSAHALQLLHRQSELDDWATGSQKQQLISLSMQREEHEHASATTRARVRERVVEHVLQAPEDVLDLLRERLEARRAAQQQQTAKSPTPAATGAVATLSSSKGSPSALSSAAGERSSTPLASSGAAAALLPADAAAAAAVAQTLPSSAPAASSPLSA
jgi:hypothetical protein